MIRASVADAERINDWVWRDRARRIDLAEFLDDPLNVCLIEGENAALFEWRGPGIYQCHVLFQCRGKDALALSHRMLDHMRAAGAKLFWTAIPNGERKVNLYARWLGFKSQGFENLSYGRCELFERG